MEKGPESEIDERKDALDSTYPGLQMEEVSLDQRGSLQGCEAHILYQGVETKGNTRWSSLESKI